MAASVDVRNYGLTVSEIFHNASPALLYEHALAGGDAQLAASGAMVTRSGAKTGRSPRDKRLVEQEPSREDVWWGNVNMPLPPDSYSEVRQSAIDYLNTCQRLYVVDGFAGWDPTHRIKVRVICARPYHALFMHNMLIRPSEAELARYGKPDYVILNAGAARAPAGAPGVGSETCVCLNFEAGELVILGTEYAGEMKKGVFTIMHYLMPREGVFSMHCSANEGPKGDVSLFFGLSGTGKTTLSADPRRMLIGDDEHCWSPQGVFNIEGGCYAKCIGLSQEKEPEIYEAVRFGTVLENTMLDPQTREVDYDDTSITENTRASYPIEFIPHVKVPCVGGHPSNVILLTCDAFGVLPPVSKLSPAMAMYHFFSGYTAKVAGTEVGVTEPSATFSACFGAAFLVRHPSSYARMLAEKLAAHDSQAWLINTGWTGGPYGVGKRIRLAHTRAIIDAIHSGELAEAPTREEPAFGLMVPKYCPGVPGEILWPRDTWDDPIAYDEQAHKLAEMFQQNVAKYPDIASQAIMSVVPHVD